MLNNLGAEAGDAGASLILFLVYFIGLQVVLRLLRKVIRRRALDVKPLGRFGKVFGVILALCAFAFSVAPIRLVAHFLLFLLWLVLGLMNFHVSSHPEQWRILNALVEIFGFLASLAAAQKFYKWYANFWSQS